MQGTNGRRQIDSGNAPNRSVVGCDRIDSNSVTVARKRVRAAHGVRGLKGTMAKDGLAAMANYIDAGSIVAGAVSLPLWAKQFGFDDDFVSLLGAMSSNAISAGIGALIGGRICDL